MYICTAPSGSSCTDAPKVLQLLLTDAQPLHVCREIRAGQTLHPEHVHVEAKEFVHVQGVDTDVVESGCSHRGSLGVTVTRLAS